MVGRRFIFDTVYIFISIFKIPEGISLGTRLCATPPGELTAADCCRGAPIEARTSQPGKECQPTHLTRRAPPVDPPEETD